MTSTRCSRPTSSFDRRSEFYSFHFSVRGQLVRGATGERDRGKAQVEAARQFLEAHRRANLPVPSEALRSCAGTSLADLGGMFVAEIEEQIAQRKIVRNDRYARDLEFDLRYVTARFATVAEITSSSWRDALDDLLSGYPEARKDGAVSWRSLQRVTCTARLLLRYANRMGLIENMPELPSPSNEDVGLEQRVGRPMSEWDRDRFLAALRKMGKTRRGARRALRIYTALLHSALRKSALERLCLRQIRWREKLIDLPPRKAKSKHACSIALNPECERAIKAELRERGDISPDEPIFGKFALRAWFKAAAAVAKIDREGLQPHHFTRHTTASIAGNNGATLAQLMALGTWETAAMAMRYVKIDAERSREALALVYGTRVKAVRKKRTRPGD